MLLKYADDGDSSGPGLLGALGLLALGGAGGFLARTGSSGSRKARAGGCRCR